MSETSNAEITKLEQFGVDRAKLAAYQVLCLPENIFSSPAPIKFLEPSDAIIFGKLLKASGVNCATPTDFGLQTQIYERRADHKWLPVIWIIDKLAIPTIIKVIGELIASSVKDKIKSAKEVPPTQVHLELYVNEHKGVTKISYEGDEKTLTKILKSIE